MLAFHLKEFLKVSHEALAELAVAIKDTGWSILRSVLKVRIWKKILCGTLVGPFRTVGIFDIV